MLQLPKLMRHIFGASLVPGRTMRQQIMLLQSPSWYCQKTFCQFHRKQITFSEICHIAGCHYDCIVLNSTNEFSLTPLTQPKLLNYCTDTDSGLIPQDHNTLIITELVYLLQ